MQGFVRSGRLAILILGLAAGSTARAAAQGKTDQPVDLNASGDVEPITGENEHALAISGFGVGGYTYDAKTNDNSFATSDNNNEDGWAATLAYTRPLFDHADMFVEVLHIDSERPARLLNAGVDPDQDQTMVQTSIRLHL